MRHGSIRPRHVNWLTDGTAHQLPALVRQAGASRVLVLTDQSIETYNPAAADVLDTLNASGLTVTRMEKAPGEPTIDTVDTATSRMRVEDTDAVVALGGGSVIDTAKAARLCHQLGLSFAEFLDSRRGYPSAAAPLIAVGTTAGTGSEFLALLTLPWVFVLWFGGVLWGCR